eukprot:CAMPEP_0175129746 /NCGR_PEP_ID=MMETSP0087-20121206/5637_1 /TAXON_ID=136419 /ORGANISM="Unknown Unknown, Strain D1" /LENGTH=271 /DNA_ID=CAMNT_0016411917 /DNA_START=109 /DNA_END=924 /DNA_ORIENTATION=-
MPSANAHKRDKAAATTSTVDDEEIAKFSRMADQWWDLKGKFAPLHALNPVRVQFIAKHLQTWSNRPSSATPLQGLSVLDIGCGGGILSESLYKLGGDVLGVDASAVNIAVANAHLEGQVQATQVDTPSPAGSLAYKHGTAESLAADGYVFDCVCALEVVEHVKDPAAFVQLVVSLVKPGGCVFLSTMSRSAQALLQTIVVAEYLLGWVPPGTHDFNKYLHPEELRDLVQHGNSARVVDVQGLTYHPLANFWTLDPADTNCNYIMVARRNLN